MKAIKILDEGLQTAQGEKQIQLAYLRGRTLPLWLLIFYPKALEN